MNEHELHMATEGLFRVMFHKIIPPDTRLWMSDCLKIQVQRHMETFSIETRISFTPCARVVPQTPIYLAYNTKERTMAAMVAGQMDFIDEHAIGDFLIKCLMVYAIEEFEHTVTDGWAP